MNSLAQCLAVGIAGFFGAVSRLLINRFCTDRFNVAFPIGTLFINISGSFVLGWFLAFAATRAGISETMRFAVAVGFLGTYTTFSTWMFESSDQFNKGAAIAALLNIVGSVLLGLIAVRAGIWLGSK